MINQHTFGLILLIGPPAVLLFMLLYKAFKESQLRNLLRGALIGLLGCFWVALVIHLLSSK